MGNYGNKTCLAKDQAIFLEKKQSKPDWCPLQDVPEKKDKNPYHNERESGYVDGWNEFVDKMLGSGDGEDHGKQTGIAEIAFALSAFINLNAVKIARALYGTAKSTMRRLHEK